MRTLLLLAGLLLGAACGSVQRSAVAVSTPDAPVWRPDLVEAARRALAAAPLGQASQRRRAYLSAQLRARRLQPLTADFRFLAAPLDTTRALGGLLAGANPLTSDTLIVVAAPLASDTLVAAWLELARVAHEVSEAHVWPRYTLLFAALPPQTPADSTLLRGFWPPARTLWLPLDALDAGGTAPTARLDRFYACLRERLRASTCTFFGTAAKNGAGIVR